MTMFYRSSAPLNYKQVVKLLGIKILPPEENDNSFDKLVGLSEPKKYLTQILELLKNRDKPENQMATLNRKLLFLGNTGVGKALTAYAFAKEANLPIIVIEGEKFVNEKYSALIHSLKVVLDQHKPAVVLLKDIEYILNLGEDKSISLFSKLTDYLNTYTDCVFITTLSTIVTLPEFLLSDKGFTLGLNFEDPDLEQRETLIKRIIKDFPHEEDIDISRVARNTFGMTGGIIHKLLRSSFNQALMDGKKKIDFESIDTVLSSSLYGYKKKLMTEKERKLTAYHEAGHVIAGYFSDPDYKTSKVEIAHRSESLGLTIQDTDEDKFTYIKKDYENDIICSFGGMAAEDLVLGTHSSGVSEDLRVANLVAEAMVKKFGMSELGPVSLGDKPAISLGEETKYYYSEYLAKKADELIHKMLFELQERTNQIMLARKDALEELAQALLEKETLYSNEITAILEKYDRNI